jgi:hypothetical protein
MMICVPATHGDGAWMPKTECACRYINNKTTKYLLRAGRIEEAQSVVALFAKHEGDPQYNLFEMQCKSHRLMASIRG